MFLNFLTANYKKHREILKNLFWRILQIFSTQGTSFVIMLLFANLLTPYDFGIYHYIFAIVHFIVIFIKFGVPSSALKYAAEYESKHDTKSKKVLFNSFLIMIFFTIIVTFLSIIFGKYFLKENYKYIVYILLLAFIMPLNTLFENIFTAFKKIKKYSILSLIINVTALFFVFFFIKYYGLIGSLIFHIFLSALIFVFSFFLIKNISFKFDYSLIKKIFSYSYLLIILDIFSFVYKSIDALILKNFNYVIEIGYYSLSTKILSIFLMIFASLGLIIAPNIIKMKSFNKIEKIKEKTKKYAIIGLLSGIIIILFLFFSINFIIKIFLIQYYTPEFLKIFYLLLLTLPLSLLESVFSSGFIVPLGKVNILTKSIIFGGAVYLPLSLIFINIYGFIGLVYCKIIVYNLVNIIKILYFFKSKI